VGAIASLAIEQHAVVLLLDRQRSNLAQVGQS